MTSRERTLAVLLVGLIALGGGGVLGYFLVYAPLEEKRAAAKKLEDEAADFDSKSAAVTAARQRIAAVKRQSLPPDLNQAKAQYKLLLEQLLRDAKLTDHKIPDMRILDSRAPATPELVIASPGPATGTALPAAAGAPALGAPKSQKKPAYTRLEFKVEVKKADIWQVVDFLRAFYSVDLLHQITFLNIVRDNKPTDARNGLDVHLTVEAIILDKADPRKTLLPPNPAPAAVLAAPARDYSFLAWKDMFYGVLPPPNVTPLTLGRIDAVTLGRDEKPAEVRVRLTGDGAAGAKVIATASGKLLPEGELKFDPKTNTIAIPGAGTEDTPEGATSTISVVVTNVEGVTAKRSFDVTIAKKPVEPEPPKPKTDIASAIRLVILSGSSDGGLKAVIYDAANPFKYEVTAVGKRVEVRRFWQATGKTWKKDLDYDQPAGVLAFADDFSATKRTFQVVAFEGDAVVLSETGRAAEPAKAESPRRPGGSRSAAPKQGPAEPLAAVAGSLAAAVPAPTLYRWTLGKSLGELGKLSPDEAKAILKRVAADGPVVTATASANR